jgi:Bifunctional DNA primase/polymerase, N-terminal
MPAELHSPASAALIYAELGFAVLPYAWMQDGRCSCGCADGCCRRRGKHPQTPALREGFGRGGSTEPAQIRAWWSEWPEANVGVDCGASGLLVLDVDPWKHGDLALRKLRSEFGDGGFLTTTTVTSAGGRHLYYRAPPGEFPTRRNWPAQGIDVLSTGFSVTVPPSIHPTGIRYEWAPELDPWNVPPQVLPAALRERLSLEPGLRWKANSLRYSLPNFELRCRLRRLTERRR